MSRSITAITPKNLANKSIEDLIDNLTLQSLDVSGGTVDFTNATIDVTGATIIGASALIPDPLEVNTINQRTAGSNINITNTSTGGVSISAGSPELFLQQSSGSAVLSSGSGTILLNSTNDNSIRLISEDPLASLADAYVELSIFRRGGGPNNQQNWTSENAGENSNEVHSGGRIVVGSFFRAFIPANGNVGNSNIPYGITFNDPPLVVISCSNPRVGVAANNLTTTTFDIDWRELVGSNQNNVVASWIVIGRPN